MSVTPSIRPIHSGAYYHIYNRGAHRDIVFRESKDYWVFRKIIRATLAKSEYENKVYIRSFCILPNHYHLLIYQQEAWAISRFMKSVGIRYARYFNQKYHLSGQVFEREYQCKYLPSEEDVLRIERYILNNPLYSNLHNWSHVGQKV